MKNETPHILEKDLYLINIQVPEARVVPMMQMQSILEN